mmetsp:Transcript_3042/g.7583  ORF Transcript_3042/g.7583 Transcript_3042/m.7583 type:complete len:239 (+) Transcript_3042:2034-2750(+)
MMPSAPSKPSEPGNQGAIPGPMRTTPTGMTPRPRPRPAASYWPECDAERPCPCSCMCCIGWMSPCGPNAAPLSEDCALYALPAALPAWLRTWPFTRGEAALAGLVVLGEPPHPSASRSLRCDRGSLGYAATGIPGGMPGWKGRAYGLGIPAAAMPGPSCARAMGSPAIIMGCMAPYGMNMGWAGRPPGMPGQGTWYMRPAPACMAARFCMRPCGSSSMASEPCSELRPAKDEGRRPCG